MLYSDLYRHMVLSLAYNTVVLQWKYDNRNNWTSTEEISDLVHELEEVNKKYGVGKTDTSTSG